MNRLRFVRVVAALLLLGSALSASASLLYKCIADPGSGPGSGGTVGSSCSWSSSTCNQCVGGWSYCSGGGGTCTLTVSMGVWTSPSVCTATNIVATSGTVVCI